MTQVHISGNTKWEATPNGPLALPMHNLTALKDFSHVPYKGKHLVYASTVKNGSYGSANFGLFKDWSQMATASQNPTTYGAVAPTIFYFAPKKIWVLCYQWAATPFAYHLSSDPTNATGWGPSYPLYTGSISGSAPFGPLDQQLIADDENMFIFFAGDNGNIYRSYMPIGNFPSTFYGNSTEIILTDQVVDLFEAVQVYKLKGQKKWLMIVECIGQVGRYYRSFTATDLKGNFTALSGLESNPFMGKSNTNITWSHDISSGDMIRSTHDQTFEINPCKMRMLFQGLNSSASNYNDLPYRPGLLTLTNPTMKHN